MTFYGLISKLFCAKYRTFDQMNDRCQRQKSWCWTTIN